MQKINWQNLIHVWYDNSGHGNDNGKVNYVADNKNTTTDGIQWGNLLFT